jgi:1-acyl-sn-glycerol-3-phosphate acyltransferase
MVKFIRSILFDASFYMASFILMVLFLPLMILPQGAIFWAGRVWVWVTMGLLKCIVGLRYRVEGAENLPSGACIVACKHQSAWETLIFHLLLRRPAIALKRELMWIPIMNLYFMRMGMVAIDRGAGASALKSLVKGGRRIMAQGRPLVVFPEGTRSLPGQEGQYQPGVAALYKNLGVPVVPVALNSGSFWGRRSFVKRPGIITWKFLPPIEPGLSRVEFMEKLVDRIESESLKLNDLATQEE